MKRFLLLLGAVAILVAAPAFAQYVYLDVNGDGVCNGNDILNSTITSVDVWFDTNHDAAGNPTTCPSGDPLSIFSYEFILHQVGSGTVAYGAMTNDFPTATVNLGLGSNSTDYHNGFGGTTIEPPGKYKVATLAITVTGLPQLQVVPETSLSGTFLTAFGSSCPGLDFDGTIKLGPNPGGTTGPGDFTSACGTAPSTPVRTTTWGAIKNLYK